MQLLGWVHLLLNLVGLLCWLKWREEMLQSTRHATGATLLSTLKRASRGRANRWLYLGLLAGLILLRALGYWHIGSDVGWSPSLNLVAITIPFRSDWFSRMLLYSLLSCAVAIAQFYSCLVLVSAANRKVPDADLLQNQMRAHLGWVERLPATVKLLLPFLAAGLLWLCLSPLLVKLGLLPATPMERNLRLAAFIGLASMLVWRYLIACVLLLHLVANYVYFGNAPFWTFINLTARNLVKPISWLPLHMGKFDGTPLIGAAIVLFLGEFLSSKLPKWYAHLP